MTIRDWIVLPLILFAVVWIAGIAWQKRVVRRESWRERAVYIVPALLAGWLLGTDTGWPLLSWRLYPMSQPIVVLAVICVWSGVGIAIWARLSLGGNWSAVVTIKEGHQLIRRGPYAVVRHPIYTGFLLTVLGTALGFGSGRGFLAFAVTLWSLVYKLRREESFLRDQFGTEYARYRQEVHAALVPLLL
jgi:protein-S-isoprenylcysteine O-methyltransferase Ste14